MNKILKNIALVGIFIIPFIVLIVSNSLFFPFITGKNFTFRILIEIVFGIWVVLAATDKAYRPKGSWLLYAAIAFVGIIGISDLLGVYPYKSFWSNYERMEGWVMLAHLFMYFISASVLLSKEKLWDAFFQNAIGVNAVVLLYSVLQVNRVIAINQNGVRVDATLGNATYLAIYAVFFFFISMLYALKRSGTYASFKNGFLFLGFNAGFFLFALPRISGQASESAVSSAYLWAFLGFLIINAIFYVAFSIKREWIAYSFIALLNLVVLYFTATRGAILGAIGGIAITGILVALFERERPIIRKAAIGMIVAAVVLVVGFYFSRNTEFVRNSPVLSRFASISPTETTTLSRIKLWNMAYQGFKERPMLGWGQENFNYVFNKYYNPELYNQEQWFDRTHNVIFDWLIAGGILGLAAYLAFFGCIIYCIWSKRGEQFSSTEKGILTGLLAAYFVHNLFVFDNLVSYIFYLTIAAYVYNRTAFRPEPESEPVANNVALPIVAAALLVVMYVVNITPLLANRALIEAIATRQTGSVEANVAAFKKALSYGSSGDSEIREQVITWANQAAGSDPAIKGRNELIALGLEEGKKQIEKTPNDARYYIFYGAFLARLEKIDEAITYISKANELSPNKQSIMFALAGAYMYKQDYQKAFEVLKKAYEVETDNLQARFSYAAAAIYIQDKKTYAELIEPLSTSTIATSDDIINAYFETKQYNKLVLLWKQRVLDNPTAQNHVSLAAAYLYVKDRKSAIAEIREAIKLEPSFKEQGEAYIKDIELGKAL